MLNKKYLFTIIALVACLLATTALAGGIKDRMIQRKPAVDALLAQGAAGENNIGLLEARTGQGADVINAENADRSKVYSAIGQKTGASPTVVGQRRATKIAQQAPAGTWLQNPNGQWYQK